MVIPSLFNDIWIIIFVFNPLVAFSYAFHKLWLVTILISIWLWLLFLLISNEFSINKIFLESISTYLSRRSCLHYLGNSPGGKVKWGPILSAAASIPVSISAVDADAGNAGTTEQTNFEKNPKCTLRESHEVYVKGYERRVNGYGFGRFLYSTNLIGPGTFESCNPGLVEKAASAAKKP